MQELPAELNARFELIGELGRGGMAVVHLVRDRQTGQEHALKVLHAHVVGQPSARRRLQRELEASRAVQHPAVLEVQELIEVPGTLALRLPALRGGTLVDELEAHGPLTVPALQRLLEDLGGALATAHSVGVLHRDVTPANVLLHDNDFVLTDFGLARLAEQHSATATSALGTPGYAAPEAWEGPSRDPRSDAFSLGAVLYFAATGEPPYGGGTALGALQRQLSGELLPIAAHRDDLPDDLAHAIEALLHPDPARRPSVEDVVRDVLPDHAQAAAERGAVLPVEGGPARVQRAQVGSALSMLALIGVGWFQDLGGFLLSTVIDGHAMPKPDLFEMSQGVAGLLLLPLALLPAIVGSLAGWRSDTERRLAPWVGLAVLSCFILLYATAAGVILPELGMTGTADMFGTMVFHLGAWVPLSAAVVLLSRPWKALRASPPVTPAAPQTEARELRVEDRAQAGLSQLRAALDDAPEAVRLDLSDHVSRLEAEVESLAGARAALQQSRANLAPDPLATSRLEARLTRARTRGQPTEALEEALAAHDAAQAEVSALDTELVGLTARLLQIRAAVAQAHRGLSERAPAHTVQLVLDDLQEKAALVARSRRQAAQA